MEFLGKLGIDFKLLIAQIINFLVLLWLLKIFLYKPLIKNLEERSESARRIEQGKKEIQRKKEEIEKKEEEMIRKTKEKTSQILKEVKTISKEERERILERTEKEVREILKQAKEKAEIDVRKTKEEERKEIRREAVSILKQILPSTFSRQLHREYFQDIIKDMGKLDFKGIKEKDSIFVLVTTAYSLEKKEKEKLKQILFSKLGFSVFEEKIGPDLIAGFSITINGFFIDASLKGKLEKILYKE
jgi:F-type H+-transporting ATPase subunit b